jgi:hypothetical protein
MRRSETSSKLRALGLAVWLWRCALSICRCALPLWRRALPVSLQALALHTPVCVAAVGVVCVTSACGSSSVINTRHEELGTLAGHSTYAFADVGALTDQGFTTGHLFNPIMQRRIRDELTRELATRGYVASAPEDASLLVSFSGGGRQDLVTQGKQEGPVVYGPAYTIDRGALVLHFIDPKTNTVLWRGWGDAIIAPDDDLDQRVRAAVRQIMSAFPASKS